MININTLQDSFYDIEGAYATVKQDAEAKVTRWFWATDSMERLDPYFYEQNKYPKGKKLTKEPVKKANKFHYGVNAMGEVVVERQYTSLMKELYYETFFNRSPEVIETYFFDYDPEKKLRNLWFFIYGDHLNQSLVVTERSFCIYDYHYTGHQLTRKTSQHTDTESQEKTDRVFEYTYNTYGILNGITEGNHFWYRKLDEAFTFQQLTAIAEEKLLKVLTHNILQHQVREALFCLYINYENSDYFPPTISYLTTAEKEAWLVKEGKNAKWVIWNPADYEIYKELEVDEESEKFFNYYNQETDMQLKDAAAIKAIINVTLKLKALLPELKLNMSHDFVIVAADLEQADLRKNFKIINPELYPQFKAVLP